MLQVFKVDAYQYFRMIMPILFELNLKKQFNNFHYKNKHLSTF